MRFVFFILMVLMVMSFSVCLAQQSLLQEAYSLHYKGETESAIELMEEYIVDNPDPQALYFLGYAYYELKNMEKANEYFNKAYNAESFYSPMEKEKD